MSFEAVFLSLLLTGGRTFFLFLCRPKRRREKTAPSKKKKKVTFQAKDLFYYLEISSLAWAFFFFREVLMEGLFIKVR